MRTRVRLAVVFLVLLLAVAATAAASPQRRQSPTAVALSWPSWKHVCELIEPVPSVNSVELLGQALAGKELPGLSMLLFVATPLACPHAGEQLLESQLAMDQLIRTSPRWSRLVSWLNENQAQLLRRPHVRPISLPSFTLTPHVVGAQGYVPVAVHWLQLGRGAVPAVDIEADAFQWPWSTTPANVVTSGLRNLRTQSLFGSQYVPLQLSAWSTWQLCIKPSGAAGACAARGLRLVPGSHHQRRRLDQLPARPRHAWVRDLHRISGRRRGRG